MTGKEFEDWLFSVGLTKTSAGRAFGVSRRSIQRWCDATRVEPIVELACRGVEAHRAVIHSANFPHANRSVGSGRVSDEPAQARLD